MAKVQADTELDEQKKAQALAKLEEERYGWRLANAGYFRRIRLLVVTRDFI